MHCLPVFGVPSAEPAVWAQKNQLSAKLKSEFVQASIEELLADSCIRRVEQKPHICSPLSVVESSYLFDSLADLGGSQGAREPPLILNSVLMVSLPSVILYKHLLNSHHLVVVNPPFDFSRSATVILNLTYLFTTAVCIILIGRKRIRSTGE